MKGRLFIIPTPVGNLEDITFRAVKTLGFVDIIAAEDTRHSMKLLNHLGISGKRLLSYHDHNEESRGKELAALIEGGKNIGLISDAGTPGISDPGYRVITYCIEAGIEIVSLPGPTALIPALVASGASADKFCFFGFPPHKKGRRTFIRKMLEYPYTAIAYESSHRILKLISQLGEEGSGSRRICVVKEISKINEAYFRGTAEELILLSEKPSFAKGEFVVIIFPADNKEISQESDKL